MASALALQCCNQLSYEDPFISDSLRAGQFVEFILAREWNETMKWCESLKYNLNEDMIVAVVIKV